MCYCLAERLIDADDGTASQALEHVAMSLIQLRHDGAQARTSLPASITGEAVMWFSTVCLPRGNQALRRSDIGMVVGAKQASRYSGPIDVYP